MDAAALAEAERQLQEAETGPPGPLAEAALTAGILRWARDGYAEAIDALDEAVRAAKLHGEPSLLARALMERAGWSYEARFTTAAWRSNAEAIEALPPGVHDELRGLALEQRLLLLRPLGWRAGASPPRPAEPREKQRYTRELLESREALRRRAPADAPEPLGDLILAETLTAAVLGVRMDRRWHEESAGLRLLPWRGERRPSWTTASDCRLFAPGMKTEYLSALLSLRHGELLAKQRDVELGLALHRMHEAAIRLEPVSLVEHCQYRPTSRWGYFCEFPGLTMLAQALHEDVGRFEAALMLGQLKDAAGHAREYGWSRRVIGLHRRDNWRLAKRFLLEPTRFEAKQAIHLLTSAMIRLESYDDHREFRGKQKSWARRAREATDARKAHAEAAEMLQELRGFFAPGRDRRAGVPKMLQRIARLFAGRWGWARSLRMIRRATTMHRIEVEAGRSDDVELLSELLLDEARLQSLLRAYDGAERTLQERDELDRRALGRGELSAEERLRATEVERALLELRKGSPAAAARRLRAALERGHAMCLERPGACSLVREHVELTLLLAAACRRAGDFEGWGAALEEAVTVGARLQFPRQADRLYAEILRGHRGRFHVTAAEVLRNETSSDGLL